MFDWTTETILNDLSRVVVLDDTDDPTIPTGEEVVFIKKLGRFPEPTSTSGRRTVSATKAVGTNPVNEIATLDLSGLTLADLTGKVIRLALDVVLSGSEQGAYARWDVYKGQPFYVEYFVATTPASIGALATALATAFNAGLKKGDVPQVVVAAAGTNLTVTATNEYQRFKGANLELIDTAYDSDATLLVEGTVTTAGKEGFGTSWFITKNLRLPTVEAIRFVGEFQDERPIANSLYNQYVFTLEADRGFTGQSAVGQKLQSKTTHTIYVLSTQAAAFESLVTPVVGTLTVIP